MKYIEVKSKKTGANIRIMELEYDSKKHEKIGEEKELKDVTKTKEQKAQIKTK